jgi:hypothetical protein
MLIFQKIAPGKPMLGRLSSGLFSAIVATATSVGSVAASGQITELEAVKTACCPDVVLEYAESLYEDLEYYRAITEYRRFLSYFPDAESRHHAQLRIVDSYLFGRQYEEAIRWSQTLVQRDDSPELVARAHLGMAHAFLRIRNLPRARDTATQATAIDDLEIRGRAFYALALARVLGGEWELSMDAFQAVPTESGLRDQAVLALQAVDNQRRISDRNPGVAALLNMVPGLGYAYIGQPQTAVAAFVVNGLGAIATYSAFSHGQPGLGAAVGLISVGWYTGGIYGARVGAMRDREARRARLFESLHRY